MYRKSKGRGRLTETLGSTISTPLGLQYHLEEVERRALVILPLFIVYGIRYLRTVKFSP